MASMRRLATGAAMLALAVACGGPDGSGAAARTTDLWSMSSDGKDLRRVTERPGDDLYAALSPDGTRLAWASTIDGDFEIYVADADGSGPVRLTGDPGRDDRPAWSPDRRRIAFASTRDGTTHLYVMDGDGANLTRLTDGVTNDVYPSWSPDGTLIAFTRGVGTPPAIEADIYVLDVASGASRRLTRFGRNVPCPVWSPDGSRIAFYDHDQERVVVMAADGSGAAELPPAGDQNGLPAWSPGDRIVFTAGSQGTHDVYAVEPDGTNLVRLTEAPGEDYLPSWSSVGSRIFFSSDR